MPAEINTLNPPSTGASEVSSVKYGCAFAMIGKQMMIDKIMDENIFDCMIKYLKFNDLLKAFLISIN